MNCQLKIKVLLFSLPLIFVSCQSYEPGYRNPMATLPKMKPGEKLATFAEGCFWHSELVFQSLVGVREVVSGYAGGKDTDPYYEKVSTGQTGHAESVQVYYDSTLISYETLVKAFFASHDPTSLNRQGQDVGSEYRSVAFYRNENERQVILNEINRLNTSKRYVNKIVTEVHPLEAFYPAEELHQEYIEKNPQNDYVRYVSVPEFLAFKLNFEANYKPIDFIEY